MTTFAAAMTDKTAGAIATVLVYGAEAKTILEKIFKPVSSKAYYRKGSILLGTIFDGDQSLDQVTVGFEDNDCLAINCHGNPLIVSDIVKLLELYGAEIVTSEKMFFALAAGENRSAVFAEAQVAGAQAKTLAGNKIVANQVTAGLSQAANRWLENPDFGRINREAKKILEDSEIAKLIIYGCRTIIVGPANSGKSTLLNALTGREKAIVTDIKGTTRDWVSGSFQCEELFVELIDTAGLGRFADSIDKTSQEKTFELLKSAQVVLLLLDNSEPEPFELPEILLDKKIIVALNKTDLAQRFVAGILPGDLAEPVKISAKTGDNLGELKSRIRRICGSGNFDLSKPVCFTERQEKIMRKLAGVNSENEASSLITELLNARNCV